MKKYKNLIAAMIAGAVNSEPSKILPLIETPPSDEMGDLAFPCFSFAKTMKKSPPSIAEDLQRKLRPAGPFEKITAAGPYLNFHLDHGVFIAEMIAEIRKAGDRYGGSDIGAGKTIVLEYSSPNIAKPFGIGHLRSTVIGAALKRIYGHLGYKVVSINHLGDWGTQFGKLLYAYKHWGDHKKLEAEPIEHLYDLYVRIHQEEENNPPLEAATRNEFKKLEAGDEENLGLWKEFSQLSKREFGKIYDLLGVEFDSDAGEAFYIDKIDKIEGMLRDSKLLSRSQDATIVNLEKFNMPPMLVRKSDETTLYATRDLAAAIYRKREFEFDKMIYVVGVAQSLYFRQLFKVLELMGQGWAKDCHHVSFGWVKLGEEMMSTRRGNIVFLEDVINRTVEKTREIMRETSPDLPDGNRIAFEVGVGAVIFADLAYKRDTDISFDWERMLDFKGYSGPYIQYSHARIQSVLRKYGRRIPDEFDAGLLQLPEEFGLVKKMASYPDILNRAAKEFEPFNISTFLLEICGLFNTYYQRYRSPEDRILSTDGGTADSRVALVSCVGNVLRSGLRLLGLSAPDMM